MISAYLAQQLINYSAGPRFSFFPICIGLSVGTAINVVVCLLLYNAQMAVPQEHRKIEPNMIWLLVIPLFNLVWNFFVFLRIPESYQSAFAARGAAHKGVGERNIGLAYCICAACSIIPCVNILTGLASLVLVIIFLVQIYNLKTQLQSSMAGGFPVNPPTNPPNPPIPPIP